MKTKTVPRAVRRKKVTSVNFIPEIGEVESAPPTAEELGINFPVQQTGTYDGFHYKWAMDSFIALMDNRVIPAKGKLFNFCDRFSGRVAPHNVPKYIQA